MQCLSTSTKYLLVSLGVVMSDEAVKQVQYSCCWNYTGATTLSEVPQVPTNSSYCRPCPACDTRLQGIAGSCSLYPTGATVSCQVPCSLLAVALHNRTDQDMSLGVPGHQGHGNLRITNDHKHRVIIHPAQMPSSTSSGREAIDTAISFSIGVWGRPIDV